jgi:hypothetical protein
MTVTELQILLDLNYGNELDVLKEHTSLTDYGYLFVDSEDGHCYPLDENGKIDDVKTLKALYVRYVKKDIKKIAIPESVKRIGHWAFYGCTSLKSIEIPEGVNSIGNWAFRNCASLTSIKILESVKNIGFCAFYDCISLEEVIFKGKTIDQVKAMYHYPWGIKDKSIIKCS